MGDDIREDKKRDRFYCVLELLRPSSQRRVPTYRHAAPEYRNPSCTYRNPSLQVARQRSPPCSLGRQLTAPRAGGRRSQATHGVACTATWRTQAQLTSDRSGQQTVFPFRCTAKKLNGKIQSICPCLYTLRVQVAIRHDALVEF